MVFLELCKHLLYNNVFGLLRIFIWKKNKKKKKNFLTAIQVWKWIEIRSAQILY